MKVLNLTTLAALGIAFTAGTAFADTVTVVCDSGESGKSNSITFEPEDGAALQEALGADFETAVCEVGKELNWETYQSPTKVRVTMSNGNEYEIMAQQN